MSVLVGSGDIYDSVTFSWTKSLFSSFSSGIWLDSGDLGNTRLDHYDTSLTWQSEQDFNGLPTGIFTHAGNALVVTLDNGNLSFSQYNIP
jgi:hypothetical protein